MSARGCSCSSRYRHFFNGVLAVLLAAAGAGGRRLAAMSTRRVPTCGLVPKKRFRSIKFPVSLRDNLQRQLFIYGGYERALGDLLLDELGPNDVYLDIGANIGVHALPAAQLLSAQGGRVIAFEAAPDTARLLRQTAELHRCDSLEVVTAALSDTDGKTLLRDSTRWGSGDTGVRSLFGDGPGAYPVSVRTFDGWASDSQLKRLDVVKVDVEGAELHVLRGMEASLRALRPRLVVVELVPELLARGGTTVEQVGDFMTRLGYAVTGVPISELADNRGGAYGANAIFRPSGTTRR